MTEYIDRGAAKYAADLAFDMTETEYDMICQKLDRVPAADVAPVVHGRWEEADWIETDDSNTEVIRTPQSRAEVFPLHVRVQKRAALEE